MGRKLIIELSHEQRVELEKHYRSQDSSHCFRQRCRMVLLKSDGVLSKDIVPIVEIKSEHEINKWVKRYQKEYATDGIKILQNKAGQGRKPIFDAEQDAEKVKTAVKQERQRLSQAKVLIEQAHDKPFGLKTLKRFLKLLTARTDASAST